MPHLEQPAATSRVVQAFLGRPADSRELGGRGGLSGTEAFSGAPTPAPRGLRRDGGDFQGRPLVRAIGSSRMASTITVASSAHAPAA